MLKFGSYIVVGVVCLAVGYLLGISRTGEKIEGSQMSVGDKLTISYPTGQVFEHIGPDGQKVRVQDTKRSKLLVTRVGSDVGPKDAGLAWNIQLDHKDGSTIIIGASALPEE